MTIPEFVDKLNETDEPWELVDGYLLRCGDDHKCPIVAVAGDGRNSNAWSIGVSLGLTPETARAIINAADGLYPMIFAALRDQLLAATVNR